MVVVGWWVGRMIEAGVIHRLGTMTSHYVESFVSPHLQSMQQTGSLDDTQRAALDSLLTETPLGKRIVAFKIWSPSGQVLYSTNAQITGQTFPIGEGLGAALRGNVHSHVSTLGESENAAEGAQWNRLVETYSPIHADRIGTVIAAAEFYQATDGLDHEIRAAQWRSWLLVAATMLVMYLLIFSLVRRGSLTIDIQRRQLNRKVVELSELIAQNARLHERVRRAALRTTALNERYLRRIAADLHDGPAQDMSLALMRFDTLAQGHRAYSVHGDDDAPSRLPDEDSRAIRSALQSALGELRAISIGLSLPEVDGLASSEIAGRAVRDFERKSNAKVTLVTTGSHPAPALPVKIALYRLIQESLTNGLRHGGGNDLRVELVSEGERLDLKVSDGGVGFDAGARRKIGRIGLEGMRERVEILGGSFDLATTPGAGTVIRVILPANQPELDDE